MAALPAQTIRALCEPLPEAARLGEYPQGVSGGPVLCWEDGEQRPAGSADGSWLRSRRRMVSPFTTRTRHRGKTYGLGPAGYDVRVAETLWLWPFWGRLASTQEYFDVPRDVTFLVQDKSSWARAFVFAMNTNAEPGWHGYLTLELVRFLPWPIRIRAGDPICNIMFLRVEAVTDQPYEGKYQDQEAGPQAARYDGGGGWMPRILRDLLDAARDTLGRLRGS